MPYFTEAYMELYEIWKKKKSMKYDLENTICYIDDLLIPFLAFNKWTTADHN